MHERTQRALARLMFVLCCAVPTLITLSVVLVTWTPWYHSRCRVALEQRFSQATGLVVTIEDFQQTSPYVLTLHGVLLLEPESRREVARVRLAEWATLDERSALRLSQPQLQAEQLAAFWRLVHDRFLCQPQQTEHPLRMHVDDLTIESHSGQPLSFRSVEMQMQPQARAVQVAIEAVPANSRDDLPIMLQIQRDRRDDAPSTNWTLQSGGTALPCSAIADFSPLLKQLGPDAEFAGNIKWQFSDGHWQLNLQGSHFRKIDLSRLFETLPHRLTGLADVKFNRGYIDPGKRVDVDGVIVARDGNIGGSLVRAAHQHLQFGVAEGALSQYNLPYDRLGVHFNLMGAQLTLHGVCSAELGYESLPPGVALCTNGQAIAVSSGTLIPSTSLAAAIAPEHSVSVPLSQQTSSVLNLLLLPSRQLPTDDFGTAARITRANPWSGERPISQPSGDRLGVDGLDRPLDSPRLGDESRSAIYDETPYSMNR